MACPYLRQRIDQCQGKEEVGVDAASGGPHVVEHRAHNGGYEEHAHNHQCKTHVCKEEIDGQLMD